MYTRFGERTLLSVVRTLGGTIERTLCKPYRRTYVGPPDVCYFLEYPLVNTWTYEAAIEPLGKNHRITPLGRMSVTFLGL
jgi:hypothetical protein